MSTWVRCYLVFPNIIYEMSVLQLPVEVLWRIFNLFNGDAVHTLETANVHWHFEDVIGNRKSIVNKAFLDMERHKPVWNSKETIHRLLTDDVQYLDSYPLAMYLSVKEEDNLPSIRHDISLIAFRSLKWLTLAELNLNPSLLVRLLRSVDSIEYVELCRCTGTPFDRRARVVTRARPWTLRCVHMKLSLSELKAAFEPDTEKNAHLRYVVFVYCAIYGQREYQQSTVNRTTGWLQLYTEDSLLVDPFIRHMNLVAVSQKWEEVDHLHYTDVVDDSFIFSDTTFDWPLVGSQDEEKASRHLCNNRISKPALHYILMEYADEEIEGLRLAMEGRDGALDISDAKMFKNFSDLTLLIICSSELTDGFFDTLMNYCDNIVDIHLLQCTGLRFDNIKVQYRRQTWVLRLSHMHFDAEKLVEAVNAIAPHSFYHLFERLCIRNCTYDHSAMLRLTETHRFLQVSTFCEKSDFWFRIDKNDVY